ncbi:MAG: pilin [Patescibacteria group bacterium]|nr:pilin [Patescibacteria group bacterium]
MFFLAKKLGVFSAILMFFVLPIFFSPVLADDQTSPSAPTNNYGLVEATKGEVGKALINSTPQSIVGTVISAILSLLGVVFFLLIFYGGIRWMMAQGNEAEIEKAKEILIAAVIGLVIVLAAYAITRFIGTQLAGAG